MALNNHAKIPHAPQPLLQGGRVPPAGCPAGQPPLAQLASPHCGVPCSPTRLCRVLSYCAVPCSAAPTARVPCPPASGARCTPVARCTAWPALTAGCAAHQPLVQGCPDLQPPLQSTLLTSPYRKMYSSQPVPGAWVPCLPSSLSLPLRKQPPQPLTSGAA